MERKDLPAAVQALAGIPAAWAAAHLAKVHPAYPAVVLWHHASGVAITARIEGNAVHGLQAIECPPNVYQQALGVLRGECAA